MNFSVDKTLTFEQAVELMFRKLGDWKIMFKTVGKVFKREGITSATSVTMEEFIGITEKEEIAHE